MNSPIYKTFWKFAVERQKIYFRRLQDETNLTKDKILQQYKFTNVYRASDRTSQYLIRHVIYRDDLPISNHEVFFRIMLFKLFNKIETWQALENEFGRVTYKDFKFKLYADFLSDLKEKDIKLYNGAYIMPPGTQSYGDSYAHINHLTLLNVMMKNHSADKLSGMAHMKEGYNYFLDFPMIGPFLAYQYVLDINYSLITRFRESEFTKAGPGAKSGLKKIFTKETRNGVNDEGLIDWLYYHQDEQFQRLGLTFDRLYTRPLQYIDIENLLCEYDKYCRVKFPAIAGAGRTHIKQLFKPKDSIPKPFFPPKWGINQWV